MPIATTHRKGGPKAGPECGPESRPGTRADKSAPERRCIVTRESGPKDGLIRFAIGPDGMVVPDVAERLPGRGLWITARRDIVAAAVARKLFSRAARQAVRIPDDLTDQVAALLTRRCIDTLALANRAGLVRAGFEKAKAAVADGSAVLLLTAADATGQDALALRRKAGDIAAPRVLDAAAMGQALGRDACVNAAVTGSGTDGGRLAAGLKRELRRLNGFETADGAVTGD